MGEAVISAHRTSYNPQSQPDGHLLKLDEKSSKMKGEAKIQICQKDIGTGTFKLNLLLSFSYWFQRSLFSVIASFGHSTCAYGFCGQVQGQQVYR